MAFTITDLLNNDNIYCITVDAALTSAGDNGELSIALNSSSAESFSNIDCVRTVSESATTFSKTLNTFKLVSAIDKNQTNILTITNTSDSFVSVQKVSLSSFKELVPDSDKSWYANAMSNFDSGFISLLNSALASSTLQDLQTFIATDFKNYFSTNKNLFKDDPEFAVAHWTSILKNGASESLVIPSVFNAINLTPGDVVELDLGQLFATAQLVPLKYPYSQAYIDSKKV